MTDYTAIVFDSLLLERTPADTSLACRSHEAALLMIDEHGQVSISTRTYDGDAGTPAAEWHRRTLTYHLADAQGGARALDIARLKTDLADGGRLAILIDRIRAGHSVEWDGSNHVGRLTEDAQDAESELRDLINDDAYASTVEVWDAGIWLIGNNSDQEVLRELGLTTSATDEDIAASVASLKNEIKLQGIVVAGDLEGVIREVIARVREDEV
ncbi:hypothetical protein [Roseomonas genomospecies 6]|uniref:DUF4376 domain-containing protein n=1 Tax=Roseomonas genomospecies 6 TaxID=214106 RepID=A0A9W7KQH3_9PROT|nr:hypothetical protein [Roseomonas genomospecies 6]KAA0677637.1 hypothetical protein DS843_22625 [Roseomonas genomospecies 6]